ncbi:Multidrug resistance protein ABC Superfamily [Phytophthora palmivora]|uniref:Multidrug resistance protein ABC Superfamily n=1 Tax=Phytophthora palmivora TaxID=4796 RepID=A0A2P4XT94_9STRA|nr:Multidrug resistance protein ABC Superfamily [Phytophthora palmivora]
MGTPLKYTNDGIPKNWDGRDWLFTLADVQVGDEDSIQGEGSRRHSKAVLSDAETEDEFDQKETTIMRMVGTSVLPELLHQIRDKAMGSEIDELWNIKFSPSGNINIHLSKMFNMRTELQTLHYNVDDIDMVEMRVCL